jgi:hypothetical protein
MPPFKPHDATHTLLYAIISHLTPPAAENTKQWQKIADLLPERPWAGDVVERWIRIEKRARVEKWLGEEEEEKDRMEGVEVRSGEKEQGKGSEVGKEGNRVVGWRAVEVGEGEGTLSLRRSNRKRQERDVDGEESEESEEEEVAIEFEKAVRRTMRLAVGKRKPRVENSDDGGYANAAAGADMMDPIQAKPQGWEKAKKGKELAEFSKRKLSTHLAAKKMSDSELESESDSEFCESDSPDEDHTDDVCTPARSRRSSKRTKRVVEEDAENS